jgi:hypothetical protein
VHALGAERVAVGAEVHVGSSYTSIAGDAIVHVAPDAAQVHAEHPRPSSRPV